jgi:hypothetical protein
MTAYYGTATRAVIGLYIRRAGADRQHAARRHRAVHGAVHRHPHPHGVHHAADALTAQGRARTQGMFATQQMRTQLKAVHAHKVWLSRSRRVHNSRPCTHTRYGCHAARLQLKAVHAEKVWLSRTRCAHSSRPCTLTRYYHSILRPYSARLHSIVQSQLRFPSTNATSFFHLKIRPQSEIECLGSRSRFQVDWGPDSDSPWPNWSDTSLRLFSNSQFFDFRKRMCTGVHALTTKKSLLPHG